LPFKETRVFVQGHETLQLRLDCVTALGPRRWIVYGWAATPRGVGSRIAVTAGAAGDCAIEHVSFHAHTATPLAANAVLHSFTLVFAPPEGARGFILTLTAGAETLRADLLDSAIPNDLVTATAERDGATSFRLFQACLGDPALAPLLHYQGQDFGAFSAWLTRMPHVAGRAVNLGPFAEVEALLSPAGEVLLMLRATTPMPHQATLSAVLAAHPHILQLHDVHVAVAGHALALYGRLDTGLRDTLAGLELVAEAEPQPGQTLHLRAHPRLVAAPDFLDAASRVLPGPGTLAPALAQAGMGLLRPILARREAAFAPRLGNLPDAAPAWPETSRIAAILGADDPVVARLFHVAATTIEARCDHLLVFGEAAEEVAQIFARRGRLQVETGAQALVTLRQAQHTLLPVDALRFAEALIDGQPDLAFANPLDAADLARLPVLHSLAGCALTLGDTLARLVRQRLLECQGRGAEAALVPLARPWSSPQAAEMVHRHLTTLWTLKCNPEARAHG